MSGAREWIPLSLAAQFAQRLRDRRKASGMTQPELARKAGVAKSTYVHWERGLVSERTHSKLQSGMSRRVWLPGDAVCSDASSRWTRGPGVMPTCWPTAMALARIGGPWSTWPSHTGWIRRTRARLSHA
ncbi:helix-turn-helix transcriptional regulator [Paraburkholderia nodosa]|uniref:helix-turn-helix transcriptional regulator n=1 Tax=Paraburkholderia nodosa TaxID=392320 RepID=UPI0009F187E3